MLLSNIVWLGDWTQFLSGLVATIIGTIIGIFGPFYLKSINDRRNKRNRAIQCLHDIKKELMGINEQFGAIKDTDIYISPIKIPVWDSLINTNEIQLLYMLKTKLLNTTDLTKQIFQIYDLIGEYNLWWNMYTQGAVVGARAQKDLSSIKAFIETSKTILLSEDANDKEYPKSIKFTLEIIEKTLKLFNTDKDKGDT